MENLKVWALYRVSTAKQLGAEDDIPMQEQEVRRMVSRHPNWELTNELYEKGVSGFKKKIDDRDIVQRIVRAAESKKFDVLAVFAHDRIGRNKEEIPPLVTYLIKVCGIQIWTSTEGEMQAKTHVDELINYIHSWRAEGESKKISERVIPAIKLINEQGIFAGGRVPYGYELFSTGEVHHKHDKFVREMRINESEIEIVRMMFDLADKKAWGCNRIANHLNKLGHKTREGKVWRFNTVQRILQHTVYVGYRRYGTFQEGTSNRLPKDKWKLQPQNDSLIAIDPEQWHRVNDQMKNRSQKKQGSNVSMMERGKLLLGGIAYCGYCGRKLHAHYNVSRYETKNGENKRYECYKYWCRSGVNEIDTHEVHYFASRKFEKIVHKTVLDIISESNFENLTKEISKSQKKILGDNERELSKLLNDRSKLKNGLDLLHEEVVKVLTGESKFTEQTLTKAIQTNELKLNDIDNEISIIEKEIERRKVDIGNTTSATKEFIDWEERYSKGDIDEKKVLLSRIINRVHIKKDEIRIDFKFDLDRIIFPS